MRQHPAPPAGSSTTPRRRRPVTNSLSSGAMSVAPATKENPRLVSRDLLEAMQRTNPLEAAMATLLIREGVWALAD